MEPYQIHIYESYVWFRGKWCVLDDFMFCLAYACRNISIGIVCMLLFCRLHVCILCCYGGDGLGCCVPLFIYKYFWQTTATNNNNNNKNRVPHIRRSQKEKSKDEEVHIKTIDYDILLCLLLCGCLFICLGKFVVALHIIASEILRVTYTIERVLD